uniref:TATA element modulatory factor n=1 Tax=Schistocephalus solidus TaxID=70667 RepID=A0A0X3PSM9_SCHSO
MAWWSSLSNASKLASLAIQEATRRIDQALDIEDNTSLSPPFEILPKNELHLEAEVDTPQYSSILSTKAPTYNTQDSQILAKDSQVKDPDEIPFLSVPNPPLPKVSDAPSFGTVGRQRHASQPASSLSSGPMLEDIACDKDEISNGSTKSVHNEGTASVSLSMGDTLTSELSRSLASTNKSSSTINLITPAALASSQPALPSDDSVTDVCSTDVFDNEEKEVEGEEIQRHQPTTTTITPPRPLSPRAQDDAVRPQDHLEDDATTTTTSSEIEVISCCTSLNGEALNDSGNSAALFPAAAEQFLQGTECHQDLGPRDRPLCQLARPVSGRRSSNSPTASQTSESALREDVSQLLEAREAKILELSRVNISLQEANAFLQSQLAQATGSTGGLTDLDSLTDEFTKRLALTERRLQAVTKERNQLRAQLAAEAHLSPAKPSSAVEPSSENSFQTRCARLEALIEEKETQIQEILKEGERMAQEQLKTNNIVKSLRAKEKTNEQKMQRTSSALTKAQAEIERLKIELATARDAESKSLGALNQVNRQNQKLEKDLACLNAELGLSREKVELLEKTVQAHETGKRQMGEKLEETQRYLSAANSRLEAMQGTEQKQAVLYEETDRLRIQIDEMRRAACKQQRNLEQAREQTAHELAYYRSRLANAEAQLELMGETASSVAKPLLSRIESLQGSLDSQTAAFEQTEQRLSAQIEELQARLLASAQTDRDLKQSLTDSETSIATLQDELKRAKLEIEGLQKQLNVSAKQLQDKDAFLQK